MKGSKFSQDLVLLGLLTTFTVFVWTALEVYHTLNKPKPPTVPQEQLEILNPKIDSTVLDNLSKKQLFNAEELQNSINLSDIKPKPTKTASPSSTRR